MCLTHCDVVNSAGQEIMLAIAGQLKHGGFLREELLFYIMMFGYTSILTRKYMQYMASGRHWGFEVKKKKTKLE
jgi:hypothetical protein